MALLHCDGFDSNTAITSSLYTVGYGVIPVYVTGRTGTGTALKGASTGTTAWSEFVRVLPSAVSTIIVGLAIKAVSGLSYQSNTILLKSGATYVTWLATETSLGLTVNRTGATLATSTTLLSSTAWQYLEIKIVCSLTSGSVTVRQNGVVTASATGINTGSATVDAVSLKFAQNGSGGTWGNPFSADDLYICDGTGSTNNDFLGDIQVSTVLPDGNGSYSGLVGSDGNSVDNYLLVDELPPSATDYVGSDTIGAKDTYSFANITTGRVPLGVMACSTATGTGSGRAVARGSNGTVVTGADKTMTGSPLIFAEVFSTDPATGAPWTEAGVNAAEFGWEVR